jgi:hypothetical protein
MKRKYKMDLLIKNIQIPECRKLRQFINDYYPHLDTTVQLNSEQQQLDLENAPIKKVEEKPFHTYYCLFLPLGIYCGFGAENIHHAYNKAAKHWGARNQIGRPYDDIPQSKVQRDCRIYIFDDIKHVTITRTQVSHTLMTKLVKAWREENP